MNIWGMKNTVLSSILLPLALGQLTAYAADADVAHRALTGTYVNFSEARKAMAAGKPVAATSVRRSAAGAAPTEVLASASSSEAAGLPLWTFNVRSSRDGNKYQGAMVGTSPFTNPQSTSVAGTIVPLVFKLHVVASAIDPTTGAITTTPGDYTASTVARDNACMPAPNLVPATVFRQSPLFNAVPFAFGGTSLGTTQYIDAIQRANFYNASSGVPGAYHVLLAPVKQVDPVVIDVPADEGVAINPAAFPAFFGTPVCGTLALVDIGWFDDYLNNVMLPNLARTAGLSPASLPIFLMYNTVLGGPPSVGFGDCCIGGYHSYGGFPTPIQTYSVADFDTTEIFGTAFANTAVVAHELGEWANDPYGINLVPPWGGTGQVSGCQSNLEVGDPLTGTIMPTVTGANGFTYDLQELAFFSWFLGAPSVALHGWYSSNATFTTDAGTPCVYQ